MRGSLARWGRPVLGVAVTVVFVWLLSRQVDSAQIGHSLATVSAGSLALAVLWLAAGYTLRIIRWWRMLRALDPSVRLGACVWPFLVSIAVNNLVPFRAGDAVRIVGFRKELNAPGMRLLGTMLIERLLDLMTLLGFFFLGLSGVRNSVIPDAFVRVVTWAAAAGALTVFLVLISASRLSRLLEWLCAHPALASRSFTPALRTHGLNLLEALSALQRPMVTAQLVALSMALWTCEGLVFATVASGLSLGAPPIAAWFSLATGTLATLIPSSPGYVGTFDFFAALGMTAYGVPRDAATAFAVVVHLVLWLPLTVAGLLYFLRPGARALRRQVAARVTAQEEIS